MLTRHELAISGAGLAAQLVATVVFWALPGGPGRTVLAGAIGLLGAVLCLSAALPRRRPLTIVGAVAALISGIGWGSWLVLALTVEPTVAVINVLGVFTVPGLLGGALVVGLGLLRHRPRRTHGFLFAALLGVVFLLLATGDRVFGATGWYLPIILTGIVLSSALAAVASIARAPRAARITAVVCGAIGALGPLVAFTPALLVGALGAVAAGLLGTRMSGRGFPAGHLSARPA